MTIQTYRVHTFDGSMVRSQWMPHWIPPLISHDIHFVWHILRQSTYYIHIYFHTCSTICRYIYIYFFLSMYTYNKYIYIYMRVSMLIYKQNVIHIYLNWYYTYMYIHIYIYTYIYIYICMYVYFVDNTNIHIERNDLHYIPLSMHVALQVFWVTSSVQCLEVQKVRLVTRGGPSPCCFFDKQVYPLVMTNIAMERSTCLMGKSTILMTMINSYVKLREGNLFSLFMHHHPYAP